MPGKYHIEDSDDESDMEIAHSKGSHNADGAQLLIIMMTHPH